MSVRRFAALGSLIALLAGCATPDVTVMSGTVLSGVTVVDTRDGSLKPGMAVVVDKGKIVTVAPANSIHATGAAQTIDATGKFVVPGYNDMHAHVVDAADARSRHGRC